MENIKSPILNFKVCTPENLKECTEWGIFYLSIEDLDIKSIFAAMEEYFKLPLEKKILNYIPNTMKYQMESYICGQKIWYNKQIKKETYSYAFGNENIIYDK